MSDHSLAPLCALGHTDPATHRIGTITIAENPGRAMASLAARTGQAKNALKAIKKLAKIDLPAPGGLVQSGDWQAFWTAPDQWMMTAPFATHEDIAAIVKTAVGDAASVTEQTDGWVRFEITGTEAPAMFERLSNVDIHKMTTGQAARTQIEHLGCFLLCHAPGSYSLVTLRSAAASMLHALDCAAKAVA